MDTGGTGLPAQAAATGAAAGGGGDIAGEVLVLRQLIQQLQDAQGRWVPRDEIGDLVGHLQAKFVQDDFWRQAVASGCTELREGVVTVKEEADQLKAEMTTLVVEARGLFNNASAAMAQLQASQQGLAEAADAR
jgi:hypothetical protein